VASAQRIDSQEKKFYIRKAREKEQELFIRPTR
jgi:hypothetical protein